MKRFFDSLNVILLACLLGFSLWAWPRLPERIPTHFGIDGVADGWTDHALASWLLLPGIAVAMTLMMAWLRMVLPRHPRWVNLPDRRRLSDLPEAAQGPVMEMISGFLAMAQTELIIVFGLIHLAAYRTALGGNSRGIMILVLILAVMASPMFLVVFFLRLQGALARGKKAAERAAAAGRANATVLLLALVGWSSFSPGAAQGATLDRFLRDSPKRSQEGPTVSSPDGRIVVGLELRDGAVLYRIDRDGRSVVRPSRLGFEFRGAPAFRDGLRIGEVQLGEMDETWEQPWGEVRFVRNHFNEMWVDLVETDSADALAPVQVQAPRHIAIVFRAFDDGVGFRYELPEQPGLAEFEISSELTEFALAGNHTAWWIPAYTPDRYELLYRSSPVSTLDTVQTPLTMKTAEGLYLTIHEAALTDYASMSLVGTGTSRLSTDLAPWADGVKVRGRTPFVTPWRTLQIADRATDLLTSYLVLNLNEPSRLEDTSWIHPMKYVGVWWEMHIGTATWGFGPIHGATTENARRYIDFAARYGLGGVLVEGWNQGWDGEWSANGDLFSFTEPYPDYDLEGVAAYAREKGVRLIGHNETAMGIENYEAQMDDAFALYERLGIRALKTGYVGDRTREGHAHHGQYMVRHFRKVVETAARYGIALDVHEPIKDTGIRRTWPNMMTREGARGQEYNAWGGDGGNPPEHATILPFTRMLAAPMDFTPGIFALETGKSEMNRVNTTLAKQLALYVVLYSPLQMAADLPENYEDRPGFQFIRDVPVDWVKTVPLAGEIGDFVAVARQDRNSEDWYVGAVTDEDARTLEIRLDFLDANRLYLADFYADGPDADWATNPFPLAIREERVDSGMTVKLALAPGGGQAIHIHPMIQ